jgi:hypothetical protein
MMSRTWGLPALTKEFLHELNVGWVEVAVGSANGHIGNLPRIVKKNAPGLLPLQLRDF